MTGAGAEWLRACWGTGQAEAVLPCEDPSPTLRRLRALRAGSRRADRRFGHHDIRTATALADGPDVDSSTRCRLDAGVSQPLHHGPAAECLAQWLRSARETCAIGRPWASSSGSHM